MADEIRAVKLAPPQACRGRLPGGAHVATPRDQSSGGRPAAKVIAGASAMFYASLAGCSQSAPRPGAPCDGARSSNPSRGRWAPIQPRPRQRCVTSRSTCRTSTWTPKRRPHDGARRAAIGGSDPQCSSSPCQATATGGYSSRRPVGRVPALRQHDQGNCTIDPKKIRQPVGGSPPHGYELALMTFHYVPEVKTSLSCCRPW